MPGHGVDRSGVASGTGGANTSVALGVIDAKGDLIVGTADGAVDNLTVGTNEKRIVADSAEATGLKYVADTVNYAIGAKGDLLVGTAADTLTAKSAGADGYSLVPSSAATDGMAWIRQAGFVLRGGYLDWTVSGNVLTVAIKTDDGGDPSDNEPVFIDFRDPTATTGSLVTRKIVAANSIAINNTALLGTINSTAFRLWCVAFDDGGTVRLALINCLITATTQPNIYPLAGWGIASSTLEDNASDSAHVFYSAGAAVTSKVYSVLGYATWEAGLATAGTWSAGPTRKQLFGFGVTLPGQGVQVMRSQIAAFAQSTTVLPADDTIPQNTEGDQFMSQAITPTSAANVLRVAASAQLSSNVATPLTIALFQDNTANALAARAHFQGTATGDVCNEVAHTLLAATSSLTTFKIRAGGNGAGTMDFNGAGSARRFGGVCFSYLNIEEVMA